MNNIRQQIEAILFASEQPVIIEELVAFFSKYYGLQLADTEILSQLEELVRLYQGESYSFQVIRTGGGYLFKSKAEYHEVIAAYTQRNTVKKLTNAALETLAIVAYKQPVTKTELEVIRGVNCDYTIQKLMERELIEIKGRSEEVGRPLLYGTSAYFLDYFGINSLDELPRLKEFVETENQIGEKENIIQQD